MEQWGIHCFKQSTLCRVFNYVVGSPYSEIMNTESWGCTGSEFSRCTHGRLQKRADVITFPNVSIRCWICSVLLKAVIQPMHHQWLPACEEYSWQFKAKIKTTHYSAKRNCIGKCCYVRTRELGDPIDHISTTKCLGYSDLEICFHFISHQGSWQSQLPTTTLSIWFSFCILTSFL